MKQTPRQRWRAGLWLATLPCLGALAQPLQDPTRPPPDRLPATAPVATGTATVPSGLSTQTGLKLVLTSPHRQLALVDGQLLRPGDEHAGARLLHTNAHTAVLQQDGQRTPLSLHPQVQKTTRQPARPALPHNPLRPPLQP